MTASNEQAAKALGLRVEVLAQFEVPEPVPEAHRRPALDRERVLFEAQLGENRLLRVTAPPE